MLNIIYTVSPHYLDAIVNETKDYLFAIQGYRDICLAIEALQTVNDRNVYGYLYMADELPKYEDMLEFIHRLDLMGGEKELLIVVKNVEDFNNFLAFYKGSKTKIKVIKGFEVMTDLIIKRAIGDILKSQLNPYELDEEEKVVRAEPHEYLEYKPLFDKRFLRILDKVRFVDNMENTLRYDELLQSGLQKEHLIYRLREAYICSIFGVRKDLEELYSNIRDNEIYMLIRSIEVIIKDNIAKGGLVNKWQRELV